MINSVVALLSTSTQDCQRQHSGAANAAGCRGVNKSHGGRRYKGADMDDNGGRDGNVVWWWWEGYLGGVTSM